MTLLRSFVGISGVNIQCLKNLKTSQITKIIHCSVDITMPCSGVVCVMDHTISAVDDEGEDAVDNNFFNHSINEKLY